MKRIIPAVIPESFSKLEATLAGIKPFTNVVQVDIVDGKFVPFTSWPYTTGDLVSDLQTLASVFQIEVDLMVQDPETVIDEYVRAGVQRVIVHLESTSKIDHILNHRKRNHYELGLSVLNDTPLDSLKPYIQSIDFVQLMGIKDIGSQGQPFDDRVITRIKELKSEYPTLPVSIDGGVNAETLSLLNKAGADRFVCGSAILRSEDPAGMYRSLEKILEA